MISKILNVIILISALLACIFLFVGYSSLLDFFPWGNDKAYVIWEPLLVYYIIPGFIMSGIVQLLALKGNAKHRYISMVVGFMLLLPTWLNFDLETDKLGRWSGVVTSFVSILWIIANLFSLISLIRHKQASKN